MPVFGLDISHHQDLGLDLAQCKREGIAFVFIKATEGNTFLDSEFATNLAEARRAGLLVAAYHYVRASAGAALQVAWISRHVPKDVPVILDVEANSGAIALTRDLVARLKGAGYRVPLLYLPRWYWQQIGQPSLLGLPPLWSSRYPDNVVGTLADEWADVPAHYWDGYGGLPVAVLQFTSSARIAGHAPLDANAYRGTHAQLAALLGGQEEEDMALDDKLPPVKMVGGATVSLSVADVLCGLAQYIPGNGAPTGPLTAHREGQYVSRILATDAIRAEIAGLRAAVDKLAGAFAGDDLTADELKSAVKAGVAEALAEGTVNVDIDVTGAVK